MPPQEAQDIFGYLPLKVMIHVANALTVPRPGLA